MKPMPLSLIASACSGELNASAQLVAGVEASGFFIDSRCVIPGGVFVAIHGDRVDGHDFAVGAVREGAVAVLVSEEINDVPCIVVPDTVAALGSIAHWYRRNVLSATVVGITGSSGKTTTKNLIGDVLDGLVVAAQGSFNTEVGVPLTILDADERTQFLVLEMGMRGLGHIAHLAVLAEPDVGVVLNVGSAHAGVMQDPRDIAGAKGELVEALTHNAFAVLNSDDPQVSEMEQRTRAKVVRFGIHESADVVASDVRVDSMGRPAFDLRIGSDDPVRVALKLHGEHFVESALAAATVGHVCGMTTSRIAERLSSALPRSPGRMEVHTTKKGVTVISDAYNANPESMRAALKALRSMSSKGRTWAVLGEMRELGELSLAEHDAIGRLAVRLDISRLVCVGEATKVMHLAASNEGSWGEESIWVADPQTAITFLDEHVQPGDTVLIKASRAVGLDVVADHLIQSGGSAA